MTQLVFQRVAIPFRQSFKHGSAERAETQAVWVTATRGACTGVGEGCPRDYVTGESLASARAFFSNHRRSWAEDVDGPDDLRDWIGAHEALIDENPAAWCAVELALLDLFARERGRSVESLLDLEPVTGVFRYTAVVGDMDGAAFDAVVGRYRQMGLLDFKLKLSGELARDREKLALLREHGVEPRAVRVDANNLWDDPAAAIRHLTSLGAPFFGIEEPVAAGQVDVLRAIGHRTGCRIILDESLLRVAQLDALADDPERWLLNIRVSKLGGLLRCRSVLDRARELGTGVIVGAQVGETSLLTRAGLTVAAAAGPLLVGQEGAFGTLLLERDVCEPPLMFGAGGRLDAGALGLSSLPGLGIAAPANDGALLAEL